jgi:hypothetical protein
VLCVGLIGELEGGATELERPLWNAPSPNLHVTDVGVALRGVCGLDSVLTGRVPLHGPGKLAGAASELEKALGEGAGVFARDPGTMLEQLSSVERRLTSFRRAGDATGGTNGLVLLGDAFPGLVTARSETPPIVTSTFSCAGVSIYLCSAGDSSGAAALSIVVLRGFPRCGLLAEAMCVAFEEVAADVTGLGLASLGSVGALRTACCCSGTRLKLLYGIEVRDG